MAGDWQAIKQLFDAARDLPPAERADFIAAASVTAQVREEVLSLLAHDDETQSEWLSGPPAAEPSQEGRRLGSWRLLRQIGSGGMGDVFEAERADGSFEGRAAVKLLKRGMDSQSVLERFALERSALARLNHPHIARLYDAGLSDEGLPYFVMELVDGVPIDQAARVRSVDQRLALFLQLADAVSHAHRRLLVHRDLKPGNVLVTAEGQVKLLDFGIAKALDPAEAGAADLTAASQRPFTPNYASPEQVRGEPVSTATDIYSLGVLLYQLLTGVRPTGRQATTPAEAARSVLEEEPTRPSGLSPDQVPDTQWLRTRRQLQGDLDNILLKSLEKTIERRYASVEALAEDVRRHRAGLPVSAHAASTGYLLRKFVGRHRVAVAAGAVAALSLLGGAALALWQARVADGQRVLAERRFDEVRQFARTMLIDVDKALQDGPTAGREKLVQTSLSYLDRLSSERATDAALTRDLAEAYERIGDIQGAGQQSNLGRPDDAAASYDKARALRERLAQQAPQDLANVAGLLSLQERLGDNARARADLRRAEMHYAEAARHAATLAQARPDSAQAQVKRIESARYHASVWYWPGNDSLGDYPRARRVIDTLAGEMAELQRRFPGQTVVLEGHSSLLNQRFDFQRLAGEFDAALVTQKQSLAIAQALVDIKPDHPTWRRWLYLAQGRTGDALIDAGDFDAGVAAWLQSIASREAVVRADPGNERALRNLANGYGPLAEHYANTDRHREALPWYRKEHALLEQLVARFPQVKALPRRLRESAHDLALSEHLNGDTAAALRRMRALEAVGDPPALDPDDAAKQRLVRARVLLAAAPAEPAQMQAALDAVALLRKRADAEPFNVTLGRDAALAAFHTGQALRQRQGAKGCELMQQGSAALAELQRSGRLSRSLGGVVRQVATDAAACART